MANYFLGTITEVLDPDLYKIKIDIPGLSREVEAFPMRGDLDEPRPGDQVLVRDVDPIYHSFYLYSEVKEDGFIGFRSRGKMIRVTEEEINISIFDPEEAYEEIDGEIPESIKAFVKITKEGNIEVSNTDSDKGEVKVDIKGKVEVNIQNDANINVTGNAEIKSPNVTITGGILNVNGVAAGSPGPFCKIPICPFTGAPHTANIVRGT